MFDEVKKVLSLKDKLTIIPRLRAVQEKWQDFANSFAATLGRMWVETSSRKQKTQLMESIKSALGVNHLYLLDNDEVRGAYELALMEATNLIKTVPTEYMERVAEALRRDFRNEAQPEGRTLSQEIAASTRITLQRAKVIARDQTAKMTSSFNATRQKSAGITEYIWRTAKDQRVVGRPAGLFPVGNPKHMNHYEREGKTFRWDKPPPDGHPGMAIQCRCYAEPIIDLDALIYRR
jgi:hypothetical protein